MWLTIFLREIVLYCRFHVLFRLTLKKVLVGLGYWRIFNSIYYINISFLIFVILEICFFLVVYRQKKNPIYAHVFRVIVHRIVNWKILLLTFLFPEAIFQRCSVKKLFLEILQNSQEKTCARDSFLIKLQALEFLFYRTPPDDWFFIFFQAYSNKILLVIFIWWSLRENKKIKSYLIFWSVFIIPLPILIVTR